MDFVILAKRKGEQEILPEKFRSIHDLLGTFASVWGVVVLINGNRITVVDKVDVNRIPHQIAIRPGKN